MTDCLSRLVKTIVGSFPVKNPHPEKRQQGWIIDLRTVDHTKPFGSSDHVCPIVAAQLIYLFQSLISSKIVIHPAYSSEYKCCFALPRIYKY